MTTNDPGGEAAEARRKAGPRKGLHQIPKLSGNTNYNWIHEYYEAQRPLPQPFSNAPLSSSTHPESDTGTPGSLHTPYWTKPHPLIYPDYDPRDGYAYPYYNYYSAWPGRCVEDAISGHIECEDRNIVGPNYLNPNYVGPNLIDPISSNVLGKKTQGVQLKNSTEKQCFEQKPGTLFANNLAMGKNW